MDEKTWNYFNAAYKDNLDYPKIIISTIHGVKGKEADDVFVFDELSYRAYKGYRADSDSEHRNFYVAVSRARQNLYLVTTFSNYRYRLPEIAEEKRS